MYANYQKMCSISEDKEPQESNTGSPVYLLETERLLFRRMQESDTEPLHEMFTNYDVMTYWSCPLHTDISQTIDFVASTIAGVPPAVDDFSLCLKSSDPATLPKVIGKMGVFWGEIGFVLHPSYWGKGIASEAMEAMLEYYWRTWPEMDSLKADVDPRNSASLKLLEKFGFVETGRAVGTYQTHLGSCDSVYLKLERPREQNAGIAVVESRCQNEGY